MKILAINSSFNGVTDEANRIIKSFINGIKSEGGEIEVVNISEMNIEPCRACTNDITYEYDETCKCDDDMQLLYPMLRDSDVWLFATPFEENVFPKELINVLDRLEPLCQPDINKYHYGKLKKKGKIVFLSVSKEYELSSFNGAINHLKSISKIYERDFAGSILRPHAWAMKAPKKVGVISNDILKAVEDAGKMLVHSGRISKELQNQISKNLITKTSFLLDVDGLE